VIVTQLALLAAVHWQLAGAVTAMFPVAASLLYEALAGEMSTEQGGCAPWRTVIDWPATVTVPERAASVGFGSAVTRTVPFPLPEAPFAIESQSRSSVAVHEQLAGAVTVTESVPPLDPNTSSTGDTTYVHGGGGPVPSCLTDTVWPAIVTVPVRAAWLWFGAAVIVTEPFPVTPGALVMEIQGLSD
jgi:hypothetical protein